MATDWMAYAAEIEAQIAQTKKHLAPLETGEITLNEQTVDGDWRDVTQQAIDRNKHALETYEEILRAVRKNYLGAR